MNFPSLKRKKRFWSNKSYDFVRVLLDNAPTLVDANSDYSSSLFTLLEHYDNFLSLNMITLFQLFLELWIGIFIKITLRLKWYAILKTMNLNLLMQSTTLKFTQKASLYPVEISSFGNFSELISCQCKTQTFPVDLCRTLR